MTLLNTDTIIEVPTEVAVCPYCGAPLTARPDWWTHEDDGTGRANNAGLECLSEPELDEDSTEHYDEWLRQHTYMPYVYWLPVDQKVLQWINQNYRFRIA